MKKVFIIILLLAIFSSILYFFDNFRKVEDIPEVKITEGALEDEEKPEDVFDIDMSLEDKILSACVLGEIQNAQTLSSESYLKVVYTALNNGYVNSNKKVFTVEEINSIVYSIFGVKLENNASIENLKYENEKYVFTKTDIKNSFLNILEQDTAAGSIYIVFEIDGESYIAKLLTNTVTGEKYIHSIIRE